MSGDGKVILALLILIIVAGIIVFIYICLRKKKRYCCKKQEKQNDFESGSMLENKSGKNDFENYSGIQMDPESRSIDASDSILEDKRGKIIREINSENTLITL